MQGQKAKILKYSLSVILAAVLLYFSFRGVEWNEFISTLKECSWVMVVLSMVAGLVSYFMRIFRWKLLLRETAPDADAATCFNAFAIGKMCDFVVPHVCEFVRCGIVAKRSKSGYDKVLGSVVLERCWDIVVLFFLMIVLLVTMWTRFGAFFLETIWHPMLENTNVWVLVAVAVLLVVAVVAILLSKKVRQFASGIWEGVKNSFKMKDKWLFLFYTLCMWIMFLLMSLFIIWALPEDFGLGLTDALFIMLVGAFAGLVPVPGGFGAFHYLVAIALSTLYSIPFNMGIIFATLSHESQAVMTLLTGIVSYIIEMFRE